LVLGSEHANLLGLFLKVLKLELGIERTFVNDAVGGEGFTNAGNAQFMEDAALERYLEAAKTIANHGNTLLSSRCMA
jgi:hypothetical protein